MSPWKSIPSQKVYVCYTNGHGASIRHIFYDAKKALKWKNTIEDMRERMLYLKDNNDKVEKLREKLYKEFHLTYYEIPIVQEVALE